MKLLYLCNLVPRKLGAFEDFLVGIGEGMKAGGDEFVCIFAGEPCGEVAAKLSAVGVTWHTIPQWVDGERVRPWAVCLPAFKIIRKEKPDVVAVHFGNELPTVLLITLVSLATVGTKTVRWVWHQHQQIQEPDRFHSIFNRLRLLSPFMDLFVAVYDGGKRSLIERGVRSNKIAVVYNGILDTAFNLRDNLLLKEAFGIADDVSVVVTVGWLVARKRIDWLLKVWRKVLDIVEDSNVVLLIVGDGPDRQYLNELARELDIEKYVIFAGERNDVREVLKRSALYVHSSQAETCTYTITEAMCCGIPAVVSEAGAAKEQIIDGENGFVISVNDSG